MRRSTGSSEADPRYARLRETATLAGERLARWTSAWIAVIGCGVIGSRLAVEAARSGASILAVDPDVAGAENLGTLPLPEGVAKAHAVAAACNGQRRGSARAEVGDVRELGAGVLAACSALVDATDDPGLARPLTRWSNGLGLPLVRAALDGSGEHERVRVLVSLGGEDGCQVCPWDVADLMATPARVPCDRGERPPTFAGGASACAAAGIALLELQRAVVGDAVSRETFADLDRGEMWRHRIERSERCLCAHERWSPETLPLAADGTLGELLDAVEARTGAGVSIEVQIAHRLARIDGPVARSSAAMLGLLDESLERLGAPRRGALVTARVPGRPPRRFLLGTGSRAARSGGET